MKVHHIVLLGLILIGIGYIGYLSLTSQQEDMPVLGLVPSRTEVSVYTNDTGLFVPDGFSISRYSNEVPGVRVLAFDTNGVMLASLMNEGKVVALPDDNKDGVSDRTQVLLEGLDRPHGILVTCGASNTECVLYIAEIDVLRSYPYDPVTREVGDPILLVELPGDEGHVTRTLHAHPNGQEILISVGSQCNACEESDQRRATVLSYNIETAEVSTYASGLRNTVFMATDPVTGEVWGTDHGRDNLGDDLPPDEVNILIRGDEYGWPYCYGKNAPDASMKATADSCVGSIPSHIDLQAHSAPLGIAFIPEEGWPRDMHNDILVAYHGSWNRSIPTGYKVVRFDLSSASREATLGPHDFLSGFFEEGSDEDTATGRPAGVVTLPGGVAYISDDKAGIIYRMQYQGE